MSGWKKMVALHVDTEDFFLETAPSLAATSLVKSPVSSFQGIAHIGNIVRVSPCDSTSS